ncbi:MAG TPA: hypothetical protein VFG65_07470 [Fimbriimonadales bacterium]|nr:hypothetical protein [Fimbriimonadales bacterium]
MILTTALAAFAMSADYIEVDVLVLNFDPIVDKMPLHEYGKWNDPHKLADEYINDIKGARLGFIRYRIKEWRDIDAFPEKTDGYVYTAESYKESKEQNTWHQPDGMDYPKMLAEYNVVPDMDNHKFDELWVFGAPYMGFWESAMAGPGAFEINGGVYDKVKSKQPFAIMGFNYERGVAEMVHDLCHRTEATMSRIYGGWEVDKLSTPWARFAANFAQSNGVAAVGTCHWPPNAEKDYDYANPRKVSSSADDWLAYPNLTGAKEMVSCETWGGPDYQRNYLKWWFSRLPKASGTSKDGRQNNWWKYVFDFNGYNDRGMAKNSGSAIIRRHTDRAVK